MLQNELGDISFFCSLMVMVILTIASTAIRMNIRIDCRMLFVILLFVHSS
ncbi:MAG: hypothetical protein ACI90V_012205 [Bacillariaceae sp.]|jgi:hypothetical protein